MSEKTITSKEYNDALKAAGSSTNLVASELKTIVDDTLNAICITVEPESILPDVSGGEWRCEPVTCGGVFADGKQISFGFDGPSQILDANARVMAGSKKLMQLVMLQIKALAGATDGYFPFNKENRAVIEQLEKMGVDTSEFTEDKI